ncbi:MAG TPA: low-specificity L-threonine aldolase [Anaerolinea sp.]|nr:low-specificity L-threonine aldolase [Anaerolinea sp.]
MNVDLRSDTVTQPTPEMREAMARAEVGDDVMGEDPNVNRLEAMAAEKMGKEAGMFVPSGTMGNLSAVLAHCGRGDEIILGNLAHTFLFEAGGTAALGGVHSFTIPNQPDGSLRLEDIRAAIRPDDPHDPVSRLILLENTHNRCGGTVLAPDYLAQVGAFARETGLLLHIDGARIFNAAAALGVPVSTLTAEADSVTFCLSKGLCAPVGSVLCGSRKFIYRARRIRKQLGGGMRQAGVLAAAGVIALEKMPSRLSEDPRRARALADGLAGVAGLTLDTPVPATNMVFAHLDGRAPISDVQVKNRLAERGVKIGVVGEGRFRMVTHYWIDDDAVAYTVQAFHEVMEKSLVG